MHLYQNPVPSSVFTSIIIKLPSYNSFYVNIIEIMLRKILEGYR